MSTQKTRIIYLDVVRIAALVCIILFHFNCEILDAAPLQSLFIPNELGPVSLGEMGVGLFVILSGATLAVAYRGNIEILRFYQRRLLALFPLFWTAYLIAFVAKAIIHQTVPFKAEISTIWLSAIGLDGFLAYRGPNCYLVGEWFFGMILCLYAVFPLLKPLVQRSPIQSIFLSIIWLAVVPFVYNRFFVMEAWRSPLIQVCFFAFGIVFAGLFERHSQILNRMAMMFTLAAALLWFFGGMHLLTCFFVSALLFGLLSMLANVAAPVIPIFALSFLGRYSFPAFLMHHVIIQALVPSLAPKATPIELQLLFVLIVILSFAAGFSIEYLTVLWMRALKQSRPISVLVQRYKLNQAAVKSEPSQST